MIRRRVPFESNLKYSSVNSMCELVDEPFAIEDLVLHDEYFSQGALVDCILS